MNKIRIGKNVSIRWRVTTNGEDEPLEGRNLTLTLCNGVFKPFQIDHEIIDNNVVSATFLGIRQMWLGVYSMALWEDYGKETQNVVDYCDAFELIRCTCGEDNNDDLTESTPVIATSDMLVGIPGLSAYEVAVRNGFRGDEEAWLASLKEPAVSAAEECRATLAEIKEESEAAIDANTDAALQAVKKANEAAKSAESSASTAEMMAKMAQNAANATMKAVTDAKKSTEAANNAATEANKVADSTSQAEIERQADELTRKANEEQRQTSFAEMKAYVDTLQSTIETLQNEIKELKSLNYLIVK